MTAARPSTLAKPAQSKEKSDCLLGRSMASGSGVTGFGSMQPGSSFGRGGRPSTDTISRSTLATGSLVAARRRLPFDPEIVNKVTRPRPVARKDGIEGLQADRLAAHEALGASEIFGDPFADAHEHGAHVDSRRWLGPVRRLKPPGRRPTSAPIAPERTNSLETTPSGPVLTPHRAGPRVGAIRLLKESLPMTVQARRADSSGGNAGHDVGVTDAPRRSTTAQGPQGAGQAVTREDRRRAERAGPEGAGRGRPRSLGRSAHLRAGTSTICSSRRVTSSRRIACGSSNGGGGSAKAVCPRFSVPRRSSAIGRRVC